jgi:hypothetical protein
MRRHGVTAVLLEQNAPTPCFCADCMRIGGAARARLRDEVFGALRRVTKRHVNARPTQEEREAALAAARRARSAAGGRASAIARKVGAL